MQNFQTRAQKGYLKPKEGTSLNFSFRYRYIHTFDMIQHYVTSFISMKNSCAVLQGLVISGIPVLWTRTAWPETPSVGENNAGVRPDTASVHDSGPVIKVREEFVLTHKFVKNSIKNIHALQITMVQEKSWNCLRFLSLHYCSIMAV